MAEGHIPEHVGTDDSLVVWSNSLYLGMQRGRAMQKGGRGRHVTQMEWIGVEVCKPTMHDQGPSGLRVALRSG